ncbi:hypothetical protein B1A_11536, partial [mine drainage metagenome]
KELVPEEADAIAGLLGVRRPVAGAPLRIPLTTLDRALRTSSVGRGLFEVLSELDGPLVDRRAVLAATDAERERQWSDLTAHPAIVSNDRLADWLE